ncbi:MAG: VTT domain-containing protein [Pseudomonadota bacterium]
MENGLIADLLAWIADNPTWSGGVIFLIAFVESLVVVGFFLPGILILFGVGALLGMGESSWLPIWIGGSLGAFCGDILSYWLGHRYQQQLRRMWPFSRYPAMLMRGMTFFERHGWKSVLAGRFIGPLRPVIPTTAGMMGMPLRAFLVVCIPACILWTPAYLLPGMLFGASLEVASEYTGRLALVVGIGVGIVWLSLWFIKSVYALSAVQSARWMRRAIRWSRRHPILGRIAGPIIDPSQPEVLSVGMLGLLLVGTLCGLALLLLLSPFGSEPGTRDLAVLAWTQALRNDITDPFMVAVSQLSRAWVLLPTMVATALWLLGANRQNAALHWAVAMVGGLVLQLLMDRALRAMPLVDIAEQSFTFLPSAPMTMTTVVLGFFSVMVAKELRRRHRKWPYLASGLLLTLLVIARVYLSLDWLSGALVGCILGLAWTAIVGMAYRARALRPFSGAVACLIFYGTLVLTLVWQVGVHLEEDLEAVRIPVTEVPLAGPDWWQDDWSILPTQRTRAAAAAAREFNLQVSVPLEDVTAGLMEAGWVEDQGASWRWLLQSLNPEADQRSLPLVGRNFLGQGEQLVLRLLTEEPERQWVLRLWDSGGRLGPEGTTLYVGQFTEERLEQRLWLFSRWRPAYPSAAALEALAEAWQGVEVRQARPGLLLIRPRLRPGSGAVSPAAPEAGFAGRPVPAAPASP